MWCSEAVARRDLLSLGLALAALGGCNLQPLLGGEAGDRVTGELAAIEVDTPKSELGLTFKNELLEALDPDGRRAAPAYSLFVRLERTKNSLAVQLDDTITRYDLTLLAKYELRSKADDKLLFQSAARRVASYNVVRAPYATLVAQQDAERRAAAGLAVEIRSRLTIFFRGRT